MSKKVCVKCKKEKPFNEFYFSTNYKRQNLEIDNEKSYRNICKECCLENSKNRRVNNLSGYYFVYFLYDFNNELFYIGKTNDIYNRIRQHQNEKRFTEDEVNYIEFEIIDSFCDASIRELYYINKYKPRLNKRDVFEGELKNTHINELHKERIYFNKDRKEFKKEVNKSINKSLKPKSTFKKNAKPVLKIDPKTNEILNQYDTCKQAEKENNISEGGVSKAAKKGSLCNGYYWKYLNAEDKITDRYKKMA